MGVLNGRDEQPDMVARWARSAEFVVAADGAAEWLLSMDMVPDISLGDLDSLPDSLRSRLPSVVPIPDQDSTDADKLLEWCRAKGAQKITLVGVQGDALDHVLGTLQSAARSELSVRLVLRTGLGWVLRSGETVTAEAEEGRRVSLVPIVPCRGVSFAGVRWALAGADLDPLGLTSLSNRALGGTVTASVAAGAALLVVEGPRDPAW